MSKESHLFKRCQSIRTVLLVLMAAIATVPPAFASSPIDIDPRIERLFSELAKVRSIDSVQLSPDGRYLAWIVRADGGSAIEVAEADGSSVRRLPNLDATNRCGPGEIAWSPDSSQLALLATCGSDGPGAKGRKQEIYIAGIEHASAPTKLVTLDGFAHSVRWTEGGRELAFLYVPGATRRASATAAIDPQIGEIALGHIEVQRIAAVSLSGGPVQLLTSADSHVFEFSVAPVGRRLAYVAATPPGNANWWTSKLFVQDAQSNATAEVLVDPGSHPGTLKGLQIGVPRWSPDGKRIAFIGGLMSDQGVIGGDIYAVSDVGGEAINLTPGIPVTPSWFSWTGLESILVSQFSNGHTQVASYEVGARHATQKRVYFTRAAGIGDGSEMMALSLSQDRHSMAYVESSLTAAPEVHAGTFEDGAPPAVTTFNAARRPLWGKIESVEWHHDGHGVQGWLVYPAHYDASRRYPMIVAVHGGPARANVPQWPSIGFGTVAFSALEYFAFFPNPRGSFGQGEAFVQANRRDFGYGDLSDILAGVDAVVRKVPVDDQRLGIDGWSYGGFMTMFSITQTNRFSAAVAGAGISNWQSYYGQNLIGQWMIPFFGASVYDDPSVYAKSSAINFIKRARTPTLLVVGERDAETPAPQSFEFWHGLRAHGVPTSLVVYPGEGHALVDAANQRDVMQRALDWFTKYLPASR